MARRRGRALPKSFKWKARKKGDKFWNSFTARKRAKIWAGKGGEVRRR